MFRLIKWAFRLGQQTERQRIAHILDEYRMTIPYSEGLSNNPAERRKREIAVANKVNEIIEAITMPTQYEESRFSVLYPKGGRDE